MPRAKKTVPKEAPNLDAIVAGVAADLTREDPVDTAVQREGFGWARDVYFAYEMLGERVTKAKAGTAARLTLCKYAKDNMEEFVRNMLPKAMTILERARDKSGDDGSMEKAEQKSIAELERILIGAKHEALEIVE